MRPIGHVLGCVLGLHIAGGAALVLVGTVALVQLSGCMRVTCRELAIVRKTWGTAVGRGLADAGITIVDAAGRLGISRQYVERLLAGVAKTIPLEHLLALSSLAGVDPAAHTTPRTTWPAKKASPPP